MNEAVMQNCMSKNHMGDMHEHVAAPQPKSLRGLVSTLLVSSNSTSKCPATSTSEAIIEARLKDRGNHPETLTIRPLFATAFPQPHCAASPKGGKGESKGPTKMSQALADTAVTYSVVLGVSVQVAILTIGCFYNFMDGWTLIVWASDRGYASCVSRLISWGFDVHDFDNGGESAIVKASRNGHADTVRELLKANADPTGGLMPAAGKKGWDALSVASYQGHPLVVVLVMVRQLLEAGANPNTAANGAEAAIMLASKGGHHELISTLVEHKANPNIRGEYEKVFQQPCSSSSQSFE
eukprot:jgi/Bigna1/81133/fgenesh1_pg.77_\